MLRDPEREKDSPELVYHVRGDIYYISKWRRYTKYQSESFVRAKDKKSRATKWPLKIIRQTLSTRCYSQGLGVVKPCVNVPEACLGPSKKLDQ